jgi:phenylpropionate dioxygenase-like ring-hydroxylating dioxygenase large terminal subunit
MSAEAGLRNYWYPAMLSRELKQKPVDVKLCGEELVLMRRDGKVYGTESRCPHRGVPLSAGRFEFPCTITCAYHGWTFDLNSGKLVAALTDGADSSVVGKVTLRTYPVTERQGVIWVFIGDEEAPPLERDVPEEFLDPELVVWPVPIVARPGNWRMGMEGGLDPSHTYYIHRFSNAMKLTLLPASRGKHWVEYEGRYITYRHEKPTMSADYPGLGQWPKEPFYKRSGFAVPKVLGWLPCGVLVTDFPAMSVNSYSWHVPVDRDHWRFWQFQTARVKGARKWWFKLKHLIIWAPLVQWMFLDQDRWATMTTTEYYNDHDGWAKERLFRPDVVVTAWRKFVEDNARGIQGPSGGAATAHSNGTTPDTDA